MTFCKHIAISDKNDSFEIFNIDGLLCLGSLHCALSARPGQESCRPEDEQPGEDRYREEVNHKISGLHENVSNALTELLQIADATPKLRNQIISTLSKIRNDFGHATKNLIDNTN